MNTLIHGARRLPSGRRRASLTAVLLVTSLITALPGTASAAPPPVPTPAPGPVDAAKAEAKKLGKPVEIPSLNTENMTTVANANGKTVGTYVYQTPVRFKDRGGKWQAIDTTLVRDGSAVRPKSVKDEVRLSPGGDTALLRVRTADGSAQVASAAKLPAPALSGDSATYADAYGPGVDLVVQVAATGVRQKIVIRQRPAKPVTFRLPIDPGAGLKYRMKSGQAEVLDEGKKVADLSPGTMLDAGAARSLASARVSGVPVTIDGTDLVYKPDAAFLADPATTYPVTLLANPTPWYGAGFPSDTFVGSDPRYAVGTGQQYMDAIVAGRNNFDGESSYYIYRSYLKYNLSGAPWYGRPILNADVRPWNYLTTHCGGPDDTPKMVVRRVTSDWALNSSSSVNLRWDRQPSTTNTGQAIKGGGVGRIRKAGNNYVNCNQPSKELYYSIEGIVQAWANGSANYGLQIAAYGDTSGTSNYREFLSTEWAGVDGRGPVLFVEYDAPDEPLAVIREYPGDEPLPASSYEEDKQWAASNMYDGDEAPGRAITPEEAQQDAAANGRSVEEPLLGAYYPDDLTDEEVAEAAKDPEPTLPPGVPTPTPNPEPTPVPPTRVLNANPYFETETAPWTAAEGTLQRSTEKAHEATASAKLVPSAGTGTVTLRSEAGIRVDPGYLHAVAGAFYPTGGDTTVQYGVDFFDSSGTLITSSVDSYPLPADTWSPVEQEYSLPPNAATAQLRVSYPAGAVTLYADALELRGPEQGTSHTVTLPVQDDAWIDSEGAVDGSSDTVWAGAWDNGVDTVYERSYLRFDTSAIAGKTVTDARLELRNAYSYGCGGAGSGITARRVTGSWSTGTLNWSNRPADTGSGESVARDPAPCANGEPPADTTWTWPVTEIAQNWAAGTANNGLVLRGADESGTAPVYDRGFRGSRFTDQAVRPLLTVTYRDGSGSPTPTPTGGPDTTPPTVVTTTPEDGAEDVGQDTQVTVRFSEPVTGARITLYNLFEETDVTGVTAASGDGTQATFTPAEPLWGVYEAQVDGAKDAAGNVVSPYTWYFQTAFGARAAAKDGARDGATVDALRVRGAETVKGKPVSRTLRPFLLANVQAGRAGVEVELARGDKVIWTTTAGDPRKGLTASVQVPPGTLKDGWTVRWRARAKDDGVTGAWSAWKEFRVEAPPARAAVAAGADPTPADVKRVIPSGKDEAKEVSFNECTTDTRARMHNGYMKNRFAFCRMHRWRATWWWNGSKDGEATGWILIRIQAKQRERRFEVSKHIWVDNTSSAPINYPIAFGNTLIDPHDSMNNTACQTLPGGGGMTGYRTLGEWKGASAQEWHITGRYTSTRMDGLDKLGSCTYTLQMSTKWPDGRHPKSVNSPVSDTVRCDSADYVRYKNAEPGGCVVMTHVPSLVMTRGDQNAKGVKFPNIYDHVKRALTPGAVTYPLPGGPTFPTVKGPKDIPGGSTSNALTRVPHAPMRDANHGFTERTCEIEFKGWDKEKKAGKDCDEFPFAATAQGSAYAKPPHNFSIWYVPSLENTQHGLVLKFWFKNNRILTSDIFWVDTQ
ncbi:hypothetical protein Skr01_23600 [Sphaerisporangium krabiense]|uniref:DNRLRE domain-containing protein n=1 Tax=Sphaerisporangium krabiense TaxID=763782 RepID=A0A7W8Z6Q2_9ACTN|nr:DNRLRE domain-containing protein [Sphaerisporangium krabiense]MBB5628108.1 hypothetical protein [Sphaerisporangium krabiense]GII62275.1 hypothetical protein Skr01_23600 [Sphaerisporangium krabiense]